MDRLPDAEELDGVPVAQPVGDEKLAILGLEHVRQRNEIAVLRVQHSDFGSLDFNGEFGGLLFHARKVWRGEVTRQPGRTVLLRRQVRSQTLERMRGANSPILEQDGRFQKRRHTTLVE